MVSLLLLLVLLVLLIPPSNPLASSPPISPPSRSGVSSATATPLETCVIVGVEDLSYHRIPQHKRATNNYFTLEEVR